MLQTASFIGLLKTLLIFVLVYTILRILLDTTSTPKTLAYLLLVFALPGVGIFVYFAFGINYRHQKSTSKSVETQRKVDLFYQANMLNETEVLAAQSKDEIAHFLPVI